MRYLHFFTAVLWLGVFNAGCTDPEPLAGEAGGPCRVTLTPCDTGLVCREGGCRAPSDEDTPTLDAIFELRMVDAPDEGAGGAGGAGGDVSTAFTLRANGSDRAAVQVTVLRRDTREPWVGTVRLWVDPPAAGQLGDTMLELDERGKASTIFQACNKADLACPYRTKLKATAAGEILTLIGASEPIMLEGGHVPPDPSVGTDPVGGDGADAGPTIINGIPEGVTPWGHRSNTCPATSTWSYIDKPDNFIMTSWNGSARGGIRINFTYVLAEDPENSLEGSFVLTGGDEIGSYPLEPRGNKFTLTFDTDEIICEGGQVQVLTPFEKSTGDSLALIHMEYRLRCGPEEVPVDGCLLLSDVE
jgi:hypothetical protein